MTPFTIEKIAVLAPMPSASVRIVTDGERRRAQEAADGVAKVLAKLVEGHEAFDGTSYRQGSNVTAALFDRSR